jgi:hypothetical protein
MIVIIPCGAKKLDHRTRAGSLYVGAYFRACKRAAFVLAPQSQILILSARYGLLGLDDEVEPYDLRMGQAGSVSIEVVRGQAEQRSLLDAEVIALGGRRYTDIACAVWPCCRTPLAGLGGLGQHMHRLSEIERRGAL